MKVTNTKDCYGNLDYHSAPSCLARNRKHLTIMKVKKLKDKAEESIRQRIALAKEQLQIKKTKDWVTMSHLIVAIGQLRNQKD